MGIYLGVLAEFFTDPLYLFPDQRPNAGVSVTIKALDHIPVHCEFSSKVYVSLD